MGRHRSGTKSLWGKAHGPRKFTAFKRLGLFGGLAVMALTPIAALDDQRPAMLGWHMYASVTHLPTINVVVSDGSREERSIGNIASGFRPEVDYFEPVARFVCSKEPNVITVHMTRERPVREESFECADF